MRERVGTGVGNIAFGEEARGSLGQCLLVELGVEEGSEGEVLGVETGYCFEH